MTQGDVSDKMPQVPARFEIRGELGRGGMAVVFHAYDKIGERDVALKFLPPTEDETARKRFHREATDLAGIYHPNVVEFYALGESGDQEFIEMEYVRGGTLTRFQRQCESLRSILKVYAQICEGLHHIHNGGLVHRDIKPANILMTRDGRPKISDLGLARKGEERSRLTQEGTLLGTASYLAPEQLRSHAVGPSVDIYALGVCLFEAVTCRHPFQANSMMGMLRAQLEDEPPSPSEVMPGLPPELDSLVLSLMEKEPDKRPSDLASLADELTRIADSLDESQDGLISSSPRAKLSRARLHMRDGLAEEALRLLDELERDTEPEMKCEVLCERARFLMGQSDREAQPVAENAVADCRARDNLKALGQALVLLGRAATKNGDWDGALLALQEARELVPSNNLDLQVELMESLADLHSEGSSSGHPKLDERDAKRFRDIASGLLNKRNPNVSRSGPSSKDTLNISKPESALSLDPGSPEISGDAPAHRKFLVPAVVLVAVLALWGIYSFLNRPAQLEIVSEPAGARVTVNGEDFVSPYSSELQAGTHNIAIYLKGYHAKKDKVNLEAGETLKMTTVLEPSSGGVSITSKPSGAKVFLNGQEKGETPVKISGLEIKKHSLKLKKEGYKPHQQAFEILGGKTRNLEFALTKKPAPPKPAYRPPARPYSSSSVRQPAHQPTQPAARPAPTYRPPPVSFPPVKIPQPKIKVRF
jgi:tetratricopeptide (TPR) repeat protein/predicted Ser/Thr protein kinase